jgi:hypothetical protein
MFPAHAPSPRYDAAAAYDAVRHRIVLFGGTTPSTLSNTADTWEYDGVDWKQYTPTSSPPGRAGAAAAFDANGGHVLIFGGTDGTTTYQDSYEWTGTTWSTVGGATKPGTRYGARAAFDSTNKYVVLFGGSSGDTHTWTFDGTNWTDKGATAGPSTGADANAMAFDANLGSVVLWGGVASATYVWNGTAWTSNATATPTARGNIVATYDSIRKQVLLFGGNSGGQLADTWTRTGTAWAQPAAFSEPPARMRASMGYDPVRHRAVLFGGQNVGRNRFGGSVPGMLNDVWEWDGHKWASGGSTGAPSARGGTFMDYDTTNKVLRLYGGDQLQAMGANTNQVPFTDVYSYNGTSWTNNSTTGRLVARTATMSYDMSTNKLVTFSGSTLNNACGSTCYAGGGVGDTWTWDTTNGWKNITGTLPPGRRNGATAYDSVRKRTVAFGGLGTSNSSLSDTWEFNSTTGTWAQITPSTSPPARSGETMFYNTDLARVVILGSPVFGLANGEDLWEFDGSTWTQRTLQGTVATRYHRSATYDSANHAIVTFGGRATDLGNVLQQGTTMLQYHPNSTAEACTSAAIDYDNDGKAGCADDECWAQCTPLCPPALNAAGLCPGSAPKCGDGACGAFEDCNICPQDCGTCAGKCGDFHCDTGETHTSCPNDC